MRRSAVALLTALASTLLGQPKASKPIKTSLCELIRDPQRLNGKLVEIRSGFVSRFQWEGFVDETCSAKVQVSAYGIFDDIRAQDGQTHHSVHPKQDHNYRGFRKYADTKFKWPDGGRCLDCPLYRILVTAEGRFDYFSGQTVAVGANPAGKGAGVSGEDLPLLRFVLQSVSDVAATPIDSSAYSRKNRRDLTLQEAHELVTAFLKDHAEGRYGPGLEKYEANDYPGFQFFQALPDPPSGRIHYAVDLKTGEVWDAPVCEKLTSPRLMKLQNAIRNRVGLTADEYRKVGRARPPCVQCEKGDSLSSHMLDFRFRDTRLSILCGF